MVEWDPEASCYCPMGGNGGKRILGQVENPIKFRRCSLSGRTIQPALLHILAQELLCLVPMEPLETELRKVDKAESLAIALATAVSILSMLFLVYTAFSML